MKHAHHFTITPWPQLRLSHAYQAARQHAGLILRERGLIVVSGGAIAPPDTRIRPRSRRMRPAC